MFNPNVMVKNIVTQPGAESLLALLLVFLWLISLLLLVGAKLPVMQQLRDIWKQWVFLVDFYISYSG
jgi:hypothetical protein